MEFTEAMRNARKEKGLKQSEVAEMLGISVSAYCGYETGRRNPDVAMIKKIASVLGTTGDKLLGTEEIRQKEIETKYVDALMIRPELQNLMKIAITASADEIEKMIKIFEALRG